jgi:hypothetical protein
VHGIKERKELREGLIAPVHARLALPGGAAQLCQQAGDGAGGTLLGLRRPGERQQRPLLGTEQNQKAHAHGQRRLEQHRGREPAEQPAPAGPIGTFQGA